MDYIWWTRITNADRFIKLVIDNIQQNRSVVLQMPQNVPWYDTMQELIIQEIESQNSNGRCIYVSESIEEPGEYLINNYCKKEKRAHYRPSIGCENFLAKSDDVVINDYILWVSCRTREQLNKWYSFVDSYNNALDKNKRGCRFIIETRDNISLRERKRIKIVSFEKTIAHYDNYLFNMLAASELGESDLFKQYLAETVSVMISDDVELSSLCVAYGRKFLDNPIGTVEAIVQSESRSDGTAFDCTASKEVMQEKLWEAQIKVIFPIIEKHRNEIVRKYRQEIEFLLPIKAAYGETFKEANEVELGTISYLASLGKIRMSSEDYNKVFKLKNARNILAHIGTLSQSEVDEIFALRTRQGDGSAVLFR